MTIIISHRGQPAKKLEKTTIAEERFLQEYVYRNPEAIPLDDYKEGARLLVLAREFPTRSGSIDAVAVDQDGDVYLVETKLYKNPDKRLVLAQVLDYGAALWKQYDEPETFLLELEKRIPELPESGLAGLLQARFEITDEEAEALLANVRENVEEGSFRFVVLMDRLEDQLKSLIQFMNWNSRFDVFGVELDFYRHEELEILIPRMYGAGVRKAAGRGTSSTRRRWDEESFFADAGDRLTPAQLSAVRRLYKWAREKGDGIVWGTGALRGSFNPRLDKVCPRSVFTVSSDGRLTINFGWMHEEPSRHYAERLAQKLQDSGLFSIPQGFPRKHVYSQISDWMGNLDGLIQILEETLIA